jgi:hypothetical protein
MTGNPWPNKNDPHVIQMIRDWWTLHPEDDPDGVDIETNVRFSTHSYRAALWLKINAASDGELETLVDSDSMYWIFLVGFAASRADL